MFEAIKKIFPSSLRPICGELSDPIQEIRLRSGAPPVLVKNGIEYRFMKPEITVTPALLDDLLHAASGGSRYTVDDSVKSGYLTLPGGHRIGICGEAVMDRNQIVGFRYLSSVSIRIAKERKGFGIPLTQSTLIVGPPGSGKTTLLRDCVRILSDELGFRVALVDERGEIAACCQGVPQMQVGGHTDILTGMKKAEGALMVLKTMNPHWIAVDEITSPADTAALMQVNHCGVKLLSTVHAYGTEDLLEKKMYRDLLENNCFEKLLLLKPGHDYHVVEVSSL